MQRNGEIPPEMRQKVLDTAARLFRDKGYAATTMRVFGQAPRDVQRRNRKLRDRYERYWQTLLEEAKRRGELRKGVHLATARLFLIGGLNHTLEWYTKR